MRQMKYIIVQKGDFEVPIIFSDLITHKDMAQDETVLGAGFVQISINYETRDFVVSCYGRSDSIGINSREEDADKILYELNRMNKW